MGAQCSTVGTENLFFPNEIVEKIAEKLGVRDRLVSRLVCKAWNDFLLDSALLGQVTVNVNDSDSTLTSMVDFPLSGSWQSYSFTNLDLTRNSTEFWSVFGDNITSIDFYNCFITPFNYSTNAYEFRIICPYLKHLGLINCEKYFMMGTKYFQLHKLLSLENLESLNLEDNKYLNDAILFELLDQINALKSLNLSNCPIAFVNALFLRFYPNKDNEIVPKKSDNILCFQVLYRYFLLTSKASQMRELILNGTRIDAPALALLSDPAQFCWERLSIDECTEIKPNSLMQFIHGQKYLKKLETGRVKISADELNLLDLTNLEHLAFQNEKIENLDFLERIPKLKALEFGISSCPRLWENLQGLRHATKLKVLNITSVSTLHDTNRGITETLCQIIPTGFRYLRELSLGFRQVTTVNLSQEFDRLAQLIIQYLGQLEVLRLRSAPVTDLGLAGTYIDEYDRRLPAGAVARLRAMYQEHMQNNPVGLSLSQLKHLKILDLDHCLELREATWKVALEIPSLEKLCLSYCTQISKSGVVSILVSCPNLEEIDLRGCGPHISNDTDIQEVVRTQSILPRMRRIMLD